MDILGHLIVNILQKEFLIMCPKPAHAAALPIFVDSNCIQQVPGQDAVGPPSPHSQCCCLCHQNHTRMLPPPVISTPVILVHTTIDTHPSSSNSLLNGLRPVVFAPQGYSQPQNQSDHDKFKCQINSHFCSDPFNSFSLILTPVSFHTGL